MQEFYLIGTIFLFVLKHFIADFALQTSPYLFRNKGNTTHPGGYIHAGLHAVGTFLICDIHTFWQGAVMLGLFDGVIHYIIDYMKSTCQELEGWVPENWQYWILLGFDQFLHYTTYLVITLILFG